MRNIIKNIIEGRKNGVAGGLSVGEEQDIITILVKDENYTNIQDIVDEVIVMFIAGTKTVQGTTTNFIANYTNRPDFRERLHKELDPFVDKIKHDFVNAYHYEMTEDLEYTKYAYYEVMRLDTPFSVSSTSSVTEPCTISGIPLEPNDAFFINMGAMHRDKDQW